MIEEAEPFALTGVILTEILQGLRRDIQRIERFLSLWDLLEPQGFSTYREAAAISRLARSKGISLKTIDSLIASIAVEHGAILFSLDKDFSCIARITSLRLYSLPELTS
jgi:predicted nucleic acid-binding protein